MSIQNISNGTWVTTGQLSTGHWVFDVPNLGYRTNAPGTLTYRNSQYTYKPTKNYVFKTEVFNFGGTSHLELRTPWLSGITPSFYFTQSGIWTVPTFPTTPLSTTVSTLIHMSSPTSSTSQTTRIRYSSSTFSSSYIKSINIEEIDWFFKGYAWGTDSDNRYSGWRYDNKNLIFNWYPAGGARRPAPFIIFNATTTPNPPRFVYNYVTTNHAYQFIDLETFNLKFTLTLTNTNSSLDVYLMNNEPIINTNISQSIINTGLLPIISNIENQFESSLKTGQFLGKISQNGTYNFYNLSGNKYLVFVTRFNINFSAGLTISDISIKGGYSLTENNKNLLLTNSNTFDNSTQLSVQSDSDTIQYSIETTTPQTLHTNNSIFFGPTGGTGSYTPFFSDLYGTVTNISLQNSKLGNSSFKSGIWENGVWNSGFRGDSVYEFNDITRTIQILGDVKWRIQITGPTQSLTDLNIGDKISISNIVAIDINDRRRFIQRYFTIVNRNNNNIVVEFETDFPFRRIEKDSKNHKILVTKNVWLNGVFLNGYFSGGIWNNGLFRGYPYITEMVDSHWVDGVFNGGHFKANRNQNQFIDTYYWEGNVGLTFGSTKHNLKVGDIVEIDKDNKDINPQYDGDVIITNIVDDYLAITNLGWGQNTSNESGKVLSQSTGLIQNFVFRDNNVAPKNSKISTDIDEIWRFNSWIDVNWSDQSTTNIGRNKQFFNNTVKVNDPNGDLLILNNRLGIGNYTPLNLYGFVTNDILSSESTFRDIDSNITRKYSLGTKWTIFNDFLGDSSEFRRPFGTSELLGGLDNFFVDGWTYSTSGSPNPGFTISRTIDGALNIEHDKDEYASFVLNNTNINIERNRYSVIEFDYLDGPDNRLVSATDSVDDFEFHFLDLFNFTTFPDFNGVELIYGGTHSFPNPPTSNLPSPWVSGLDYKKVKSTRKVEYFYNRTELDMTFISLAQSNYLSNNYLTQSFKFEIDNIKFYEVDMIPFFQYTTEDYINRSVQVPLQAVSPTIDYNDEGFIFINSIKLGYDGIFLNQSDIIFATQFQDPGDILFDR